jgi:hypothetical protein
MDTKWISNKYIRKYHLIRLLSYLTVEIKQHLSVKKHSHSNHIVLSGNQATTLGSVDRS